MDERPSYLVKLDPTVSQEDIEKLRVAFSTISANVTKAGRTLFVHLGAVLQSAGTAIQKMFGTVKKSLEIVLYEMRCEHGGNQEDAARYPREWVSTICGAWLCMAGGETCPSDQYKLGCHCTCHEGGRK